MKQDIRKMEMKRKEMSSSLDKYQGDFFLSNKDNSTHNIMHTEPVENESEGTKGSGEESTARKKKEMTKSQSSKTLVLNSRQGA